MPCAARTDHQGINTHHLGAASMSGLVDAGPNNHKYVRSLHTGCQKIGEQVCSAGAAFSKPVLISLLLLH